MGYLGLLGIPLALLGIATSVAMAAPKAPNPEAAPVAQSVTAQAGQQVADTDTETNDDASVADPQADTETAGTPETNDDASGPQEAPGTETAD